jgi:hypothetical protein
LQLLQDALVALGYPDVAFTNYEDWETKQLSRRSLATKIYPSGVETALRFYRSFSFVGGLVFKHEAALSHETDRWDQSVYYQIYLATRIISAGGLLATIDLTVVSKDVRIEGHKVFTYVDKWRSAEWSFKQRHTGVDSVLRVTWDAIKPYLVVTMHSTYSGKRQLRNRARSILQREQKPASMWRHAKPVSGRQQTVLGHTILPVV